MKASEHKPIGDPSRLISAEEVADMLSISTRTVWRLLSTGQMVQPIRIGGSVRWRLGEVCQWIDNGCPVVTK
ncbi:helix-turn-helix domain-containing protein [Botrimarina sp.]|uniref:helix-turn-helix transcriptional regulator n=1 Tax=Botrimarina sp. TaxID=2795802 RepID=UPI0032F044D6